MREKGGDRKWNEKKGRKKKNRIREEAREKWEKWKQEIKNGREKKNSTSFLMFCGTCIEIIKKFYKIQVIQKYIKFKINNNSNRESKDR